jgi:hypothetical protein
MSDEEKLDQPEAKRPRCQKPDVIVVVGTGDKQQEFECYKVLLGLASHVFDAMLSSNMKEGATGKIFLPDKDPCYWEHFYSFIDPTTSHSAKVTESSLFVLTPWFYQYQMEVPLKMCTTFICDRKKLNISHANVAKCLVNDFLPYIQLAARHNLELSYQLLSTSFKPSLRNCRDSICASIDSINAIVAFLQQKEPGTLFGMI